MQDIWTYLSGRTGRFILLIPIIWRYHWQRFRYFKKFWYCTRYSSNSESYQSTFFVFDKELYRHHTAFAIKIVFDWIYILFLIFTLNRGKQYFLSNRIF